MNNLFSVKDQVVVITGGTGVLGKAIAAHLAEEGAKVVILAALCSGTLGVEELTEKSKRLPMTRIMTPVIQTAGSAVSSKTRVETPFMWSKQQEL